MNTMIDRRQLLRTGAAASVIAGSQFFMGIPALADYAVGPTVRRNASSMAANDPILRGYRRAIRAMRALPDTNPCSWFYQAAIHGTNDPRNLLSWNTCHTNSSFFWAWHRMYLYWFERIVRKQAGMHDWAIPYWNWANPAERAIPAPFRVTSDAQLFDASRNPTLNGGGLLSASLGTAVNNAMTALTYSNAQSSVNGPHGTVHMTVTGNMCCFSSAARDPIFWVHHAQVDRLWNLWLAQGGGRSSPVGDAAWRTTTYTFFDECCQPVRMSGCDVVRAALQLSYAYEGEPPQVNQYCPRIPFGGLDVLTLAAARRSLLLERVPVRIPLVPREAGDAGKRVMDVLRSGQRNLALQIRDVQAETQPGISWEVHVGRAGFTPNPRTLIGIFSLFGAGLRDRAQHFQPAEFVFPLGAALRGMDPATMEVVFVPVSGLERGAGAEALQLRSPVRIGEVAIIVDAPMPQLPREEQEGLRRQEQSE
ncbi:tyrosinase family protein [Allosphingosinicella sp.]|jgi:tyrosinase|uniref:tyrosinase family protein n=1 Tax=Allosphingosinicella sp. TaxID=2823234 RepID=UPI002EF73B74